MCGYNNINNSFNNVGNENTSGSCGCSSYSSCSNCNLPTTNIRCGSSYVPVQTFRAAYSPSEGLDNGSMFPELIRTYYPGQSLTEINYLRNYNERGCQR